MGIGTGPAGFIRDAEGCGLMTTRDILLAVPHDTLLWVLLMKWNYDYIYFALVSCL